MKQNVTSLEKEHSTEQRRYCVELCRAIFGTQDMKPSTQHALITTYAPQIQKALIESNLLIVRNNK